MIEQTNAKFFLIIHTQESVIGAAFSTEKQVSFINYVMITFQLQIYRKYS